MAENTYQGVVRGRIIEIRFSFSGKLAVFNKKTGDKVKKGELLASLDKTTLQTELDRQLSDYEKKRSDFEIFNLEKGIPTNDIAKYLKSAKQAELNAVVKEVELAKIKLDQTDLFSPLDGIIINDSQLIPGIYLTPASGPITVLDSQFYFLEISLKQEDIPLFLKQRTATITINGKQYQGTSLPVVSRPDEKFKVILEISDPVNLFLGLTGEAVFQP